MPFYAAECFDSGLFTILSVVLNQNAPGYSQFRIKSVEAWKVLGLKEQAIEAIVLRKAGLQPEQIRDALRDEMPCLIGNGFGDLGKTYYELGFWFGTLFLALMSDLSGIVRDSIHTLKYKSAEAKNPQPLLDFIQSSEDTLANGQNVDIAKLASFAEEFHLWIVANVTIDQRRNWMEVIMSESLLPKVPYLGKAFKEIYDVAHSGNVTEKKPWWKVW